MTGLLHRLRWLPLLVMMGLIFYLSHLSGSSVQMPHFRQSDKVAHAMAYCTLGLSFLYALPPRWHSRSLVVIGVSVLLFCGFYGLTDEFHQSFVPGREVSGGDVMADVLGGLVAWVLYTGWRWWRRKQSP